MLGCAASLAVLPGTAAAADTIRDNQQWILNMMNVPAAWQLTRGGGVTVAVIDSGVNPDVSDLAGSVVTGPDYTGVSTKPSNPDWGVHGTWMASLIAGHGHDGGDSGVIGVAPRSTILSIRVIPDRADPHYGRYSREQEPDIQNSLAEGIDYAVRHGAKVISMSIGYSAPNGAVKQALAAAYSRGVVVIASAGNSGAPGGTSDGGQAPESFPADYPGVISVGAVNEGGTVAGFSSDNLSVQVAAPGVSVPAQGRDGQYWWVSGTSPACALVAGVAALIKSKIPGPGPQPGGQRADLDHHQPPARRLQQPGRVRHRRRRRGPGQGGQAGRRPARPGRHRRRRPLRRRPGRRSPAPGPPPRLRPARPVRPARPDLPGPHRRRRHPPGHPPPDPPMTDPAEPPPLDDFASRVLDVVDSIPAGRVMSYGDIAEYLGWVRGQTGWVRGKQGAAWARGRSAG